VYKAHFPSPVLLSRIISRFSLFDQNCLSIKIWLFKLLSRPPKPIMTIKMSVQASSFKMYIKSGYFCLRDDSINFKTNGTCLSDSRKIALHKPLHTRKWNNFGIMALLLRKSNMTKRHARVRKELLVSTCVVLPSQCKHKHSKISWMAFFGAALFQDVQQKDDMFGSSNSIKNNCVVSSRVSCC
jgi:hypothetical protein